MPQERIDWTKPVRTILNKKPAKLVHTMEQARRYAHIVEIDGECYTLDEYGRWCEGGSFLDVENDVENTPEVE